MEDKTVTIHLKSYSELLDKIEQLETSLEQSKSANKRIKEEAKYLDYNRLLDRFNRQKEKLERYEKVLEEIAREPKVGEGSESADLIANELINSAKAALSC
ncbi:hypothetical protein EVU96_08665 [Bacillus infantis]|uniref:hypothetical protein n=1 Tax=Bacillus infantis TaxID=324767 RepID=UPI00101C137B|nr:hypothetical protein [Bacillus infantis]RYI30475.1 hypothetical protein EVU96_08665 [Bacillus infantis]